MSKEYLVRFYQSHLADKVLRLTEPLQKTFGLDIFGYSRLEQDGKYFQVTTDAAKSEDYFLNDHYIANPLTRNPKLYGNGYGVYDLNQIAMIDSGQKKMNDKYKFNNFMFYLFKENDESHLFFFSANKPQLHLEGIFVNNMSILEKYCHYFKEKWSPYYSQMDRYSLDMKKSMGLTYNKIQKGIPFQPDVNQKELFLNKIGLLNTYPSQVLTKREVDCLQLLSLHLPVKSVALYLDLSPRTVESYIVNVRNKFGFETTSELLRHFSDWKHYGLF